MKGRVVLIVLGTIVLFLYLAQYILKLDYLKFWPRIYLGIAGLSFMIFMHIYSIRKKKKTFFLFKYLPFKLVTFLNIHIILATIGVAFIIVHAIGSYDSIIAWVSFFSMFMVWQSGFVGKYIFIRIPKDNSGLLLEKIGIMEKLEDLNSEFIKSMKDNHENKNFQNFMIEYLGSFGKSMQMLHYGKTSNLLIEESGEKEKNDRKKYSIMRFFSNFMKTYKAWKLYKNNMNHLRKHEIVFSKGTPIESQKDYLEHVEQYEDKMREILLLHFQIEFFDVLKALFKNWHDIHVPLTYLLYTTAALHVIVIVLFSSYAH